MKKAFTIIELVICLAITVIAMTMIVSGLGGCSYYKQSQNANYQCIKTYTLKSTKRVDLKSENGMITTMRVDDNAIAGVYNSDTIYAQFQSEKWYNVSSVGYREEGINSKFPLIISAMEISDPTVKR